jgi:pyruvate dehydrogenase E2 component (dihydrolipoamide acetyltransferase)/2-oxoglutarate dehydrogenase E2 component (dihydrolipoamide succinyltransferase)
MPHDVTMPQLGMAQDAGRIVAWLKKPGERVAAGDALFEVETDKATMEVEAQAGGYLTDVRAGEGEDVPVGRVIARISETAEAPAAAPGAAVSRADALPEGRPVTMPQLGMAQDTGVVVAWHVAPGDKVAEGVVLFEVETDKTTMEVPASASGYVAALLAGEGEEVPVGEAVAILSDRAPDAPVRRTRAGAGAPVTAAPSPAPAASAPPAAPKPEVPVPATRPAPPVSSAPLANGRILASPKARKLALERGIDLAALVSAGVPQPFHVRDVEAFQAPAAAPASHRITAETLRDGFTPFAAWAAETVGIVDRAALLTGFAAASLRAATGDTRPICVTVTGQGTERRYVDPDLALGRAEPSPDAPPPALVLRDLRHSRITALDTGPSPAPVMTLGGRGDALTVSLVWTEGQLASDAAMALADGFAARLEEPLRHLL